MLFLAGFCDFEMDFCGWVNNPPAEFGVDWDWLSAASGGLLIPNKDHSTGSDLGKSPHTYFILSNLALPYLIHAFITSKLPF